MRYGSLALPTIAVLATLVAAGCGGASDQRQVRDALAHYERAVTKHDYADLCRNVLASQLLQRLSRVGIPCEQALRIGLGGVRRPTLEILPVKVTGSSALALVRSGAARQPTSTDTVQLVREQGHWHLSALAGQQPPAPKPKRPGD
jgi:hypothetical protein